MRISKILLLSVLMVIVVSLVAFAEGNAEKGKALFNDSKLGGGTSGKTCNSCHPEGKGVEIAAGKKEFTIMGHKRNSLEEAVNGCIEGALKGKAIDVKSDDMANIVAYIKSLIKPAEAPMKQGY